MALTRRSLVERGGMMALSSAVWPSWMPRLVFRPEGTPPKGDIMIVIFARGGYDGLNMIIPFGEEAQYFDKRKALGIPTPDAKGLANDMKGIDLDGFFGMHPALGASTKGRWKEWYDNGIMAAVHAVAMNDPTRSHFDAQDFMERGTPGQKSLNSGWLNRHLSTMASQNKSPFRAVGMGTMVQASLRGSVPAVALQSIADFHLQGRTSEIARFQQHLDYLYRGEGWLDEQGQETFAALNMIQEAVSGTTYKPENGAIYTSTNGFHRGLMQIAQLVKADVGLEVACIDLGGWDTHANQVDAANAATGGMANNMQSMATGITAFIDDMRPYFDPTDKGHQGVTIMIMSEFGRRAYENGGRGTDHGHGNAMFLFGKGINGGKVYGEWPGLADEKLDRGDLAGKTEYRNVLAEIVTRRAGNTKTSQVFPNFTFNYLGLAQPLADAVVPTEEPPTPQPTAVPKPTDPPVVVPTHKVYLPWGQK